MSPRHKRMLDEVLSLPTAPFVESAVLDYVRDFVAARPPLSARADRWGNLLVGYARGPKRAAGPLVLAAHADHPGFVAEKMLGPKRLRARWFGGVDTSLFRGARVRFFPPGAGRLCPGVPGTIVSLTLRPRERADGVRHALKRADRVTVAVDQPVPPGSPGMWDLPNLRRRGGQLLARGHDDLACVAALLCLLDDLCRRRVNARLTCAFTRAEESGFVGAIGLARDRTLPADATFVSLEASSASAGGVRLGDGPILRVGDRVAIFDQATSRWMERVGRDLAKSRPGFRFQRKLMSGGTCEATPLAVFGYAAAALCLPLGNYHNMDPRGRLAPEIIDLGDFENLVAWLVALVQRAGERAAADKELASRLLSLFAQNQELLARW